MKTKLYNFLIIFIFKQAKVGVSESLKHELIHGYPIVEEKKGDIVAQFKYTIMILKGKTLVIAGLPLDEALFKTDNKIENKEIIDLLAVNYILPFH